MKKYYQFIFLPIVVLSLTALPALGIELKNPLGAVNDINSLVVNVIKAILGIVGAIALAIFVYGGFMMLISGGKSERVKKGQEALYWATIGLVIIFTSYGLTQSLFKLLSGKGL